MATQPTEPGAASAALAAEEAERLASQFRPSWDTDDAAPAAHDPAAATLVSQMAAAPAPLSPAPIIAAPPAVDAPPMRRPIGGRTMLGMAPPPAHAAPVPEVPDLTDEAAPNSTNGQAAASIAAGPVLPPKRQDFAACFLPPSCC